jgi:hypothetical protein
MFPKLLAGIVVMGTTAAGLLTMRQQRLEACHDLARLRGRLGECRRELWELDLAIAGCCSPEALRNATEDLADRWAPLCTPEEDPRDPDAEVATQERGPR